MTGGLRPYPEYRDSGVPSLGAIPKHWDARHLRRLARVQLSNVDKHTVDGEVAVRLCNYTDVYRHRFILPGMVFMDASAAPREIAKFELRKGDVLLTKDSESWTDIAVPAYVTTDLPGVLCGYHLAQIRPYTEALSGEYLMRAFEADPIADQFRVAANGVTRFALSGGDIAAGLFPVPSRAEQDQIAQFLAEVDRCINHLIRAKRRLIELLNEQKQAIITQAVTRGLDPNVRLKPSDIDWLPRIPDHWLSVRVGTLASSLQTGPFGSQLHAHDYTSAGTPVVNPSHMRNGCIVPDARCTVSEEKAAELSRHRLHPGDIVLARRGELGRCALVREREAGWLCGTGSFRMSLKERSADPEYITQLLLSKGVGEWLSLQSVGSTMENLNRSILARLPLPLPPRHEQRAIVDHLAEQLGTVDVAADLARREMQVLWEYRTRLIADVVTGKLDVRGVELPALDESEMSEDVDADAEPEAEEVGESEEPADAGD